MRTFEDRLKDAIKNSDESFAYELDSKQQDLIGKIESNKLTLIHQSRQIGGTTALVWSIVEHLWAGMNVVYVPSTYGNQQEVLNLFPKETRDKNFVNLSYTGSLLVTKDINLVSSFASFVDLWVFDNPDPRLILGSEDNPFAVRYREWFTKFGLHNRKRVISFTPNQGNAHAWKAWIGTGYFDKHPEEYVVIPWWHLLSRNGSNPFKVIREMTDIETVIGSKEFHIEYCCNFGDQQFPVFSTQEKINSLVKTTIWPTVVV